MLNMRPRKRDEKQRKRLTLHSNPILNRHQIIRQWGVEIEDPKLIANWSKGEVICQDAFYHGKCMTAFETFHWRSVKMIATKI